MVTIDALRELIRRDHGLAVVSTVRGDGTVANSVVNCGVLGHPLDGEPVVGFVVRGDAVKLRRLRADRRVTVTVRAGWEWASAEGPVDIVGPDDALDGFPPDALAALLREVFAAAGGTHDDWSAYDRVMHEERRAAVLVRPLRLSGVVRA